MREQYSRYRGKAGRLVATDQLLHTPQVSCAYVPNGILCNPSDQRKQPPALPSPTWVLSLSHALQERAYPHGAKIQDPSPNPEKQNSCFSTKPCQGVAHARARVGKIRFFDHPYNPLMQEQFSASGGKAVKPGPTGNLQVGFAPSRRVRQYANEEANCGALRCPVRCWMGVGGLQKLSRGKSRGTAGEPEVQRDGW